MYVEGSKFLLAFKVKLKSIQSSSGCRMADSPPLFPQMLLFLSATKTVQLQREPARPASCLVSGKSPGRLNVQRSDLAKRLVVEGEPGVDCDG